MQRGQLTVEYLVILVAMLLLFSAISLDLIDFSLSNTQEIQTGEIVRTAASLLNYSVLSISLQGPGASKQVFLRAPSDCDFAVSASAITLECTPGSVSYDKYNGKTVGPVLPPDVSYQCVSGCTDSKIKSNSLGGVRIVKT